MKLVFTQENSPVVHSAKNILEMNGIDCRLKNEHGSSIGSAFGSANWLELWVNNDNDFDKAKTIIDQEILNPADKPTWVCSQCNETNDGNFKICWKCQSPAE